MSPQSFLQLADPLPEAMALVSRSGDILAANHKMGKLLRKTAKELQDQSLARILSDPPSAIERYLHACARVRDPLPGVLTLDGGEGELIPCNALGFVVTPSLEGAPSVLLLRLVPKSEAPDKFVALNHQIDRLKKEILARMEIEETLRVVDRRKDRFLAMLGHELRNPLNTISNALYTLRRPEIDAARQQRAREIMERQVRQMSQIVCDLLDVSRIAQGRMSLQPVRVDLAQIAHQAVEDHKDQYAGAGVRLALSTPEEPVWVEGDAVRLNQALVNLLHNALKFTDAGGSVEVSLRVKPGEGSAELAVTDTGIGIAPEKLSTLFDTFALEETRQDKNHGGLGLGLPLVKGLVELHGGEAEVNSDGEGKGTQVTLRFPLSAAEGEVCR